MTARAISASVEKMRGTRLAALCLLVACRTPYQSMGFRGGYRDKSLGPDRYLVEVEVNGFTSRGRALEYLHRRAGELCPMGYVVVDRESGAHYQLVGQSVVTKPNASAVIECRATGESTR